LNIIIQIYIYHLYQKNLNFFKKDFNQIIVNKYLPGQGIGPHTDHVKFFGDIIISLSLESGCEMIFKNKTNTKSI